jgi:hypothetical protein
MYTDTKKTEGFIETVRSSATLLVRTLDRLHFDYSETAARDLRERVELLAELDRLEHKEAPIPMDYLRQRVRLLQAHAKVNNWRYDGVKTSVIAKRIVLLKELKILESDDGPDFTEQQIAARIRAIRDLRERQEMRDRKAKLRAENEAELEADNENEIAA